MRGVKQSADDLGNSKAPGESDSFRGFKGSNTMLGKPVKVKAAEVDPEPVKNAYQPAMQSYKQQSSQFSSYMDKLPGGLGNKLKLFQGLDTSNPQAAMKAMQQLTGDTKGLGEAMRGLR